MHIDRAISAKWVMRGACVFVLISHLSLAAELPPGLLSQLASEDFKVRELAQTELLQWARKGPAAEIDALMRMSQEADDPEIRARCMDILRDLAHDDYLTDGEGYIGIRMWDDTANVPDDPEPRSVVRVDQVLKDSAADQAGLKVNDRIVGLNDMVWRDGRASKEFMAEIRKLRPKTKISLKILRKGKVLDLEVTLGRRPAYANNPRLRMRPLEYEKAERADRESYFRQWLELKKSRK